MLTTSRINAFSDFVDLYASLTPEAPAIICGTQRLSYAELSRKSNRLAHALIESGVKSESLVGICAERSLDMLVAVLAILKAGGAYVPFDPAYPSDRLAYMLEDAAVNLVLAQKTTVESLPANRARYLLLDTFDDTPYSDTAPAPATDPARLAYVIYTSGSTGKPKGVMIEQRSLLAFAEWTTTRFTAAETSRVLAASSLSFDISVMEFAAAFASGGALVIVKNVLDLLLDPPREPISMIVSVPSPIAELVRARAIPASVRTLMVGGEILSRALAADIYATTNINQLINAWGVTEDTIVSTIHVASKNPVCDPPIGEALIGRGVHLLDADLKPVPVGTPGELCCTGNGVARGYLNRAELNSQRFVPNPFGDSALMYRSGDLAVQTPEGDIRFIGRNDQQVKIRGYRIELGEIEAALVNHPMIAQVAVVAKTIAGNTSLAMYAVECEGQRLTLANVESFLLNRLPKHMIPSSLTVLEAMPLGPTGKMNRKALQDLVRERPELEQTFVAPRNTVEEKLAILFSTLLGIDRIGVCDNFFALGGQSLTAARAVAEMTQAFPQEVGDLERRLGERALLTLFWQYPTIECIAAGLQNIAFAIGANQSVEDVHCLQTGASEKSPIFILHGVLDGEAFYAWNLAHLLGKEQALYTLAPHGLGGKPVPATIEAMALENLAKIRRIQPHGPYQFAGYCNGAMVCYEMARMLAAQGESVKKLILIAAPGHNIPFAKLEAALVMLRKWTGLSDSLYRTLFLRLRARVVHARRLFMRTPISRGEKVEDTNDWSPQATKRRDAMIAAVDTYIPKPYDGETHLLYGEDDCYFKLHTPFADWARVVRNLRTTLIPGDHHFIDRHPEVLVKFFFD